MFKLIVHGCFHQIALVVLPSFIDGLRNCTHQIDIMISGKSHSIQLLILELQLPQCLPLYRRVVFCVRFFPADNAKLRASYMWFTGYIQGSIYDRHCTRHPAAVSGKPLVLSVLPAASKLPNKELKNLGF